MSDGHFVKRSSRLLICGKWALVAANLMVAWLLASALVLNAAIFFQQRVWYEGYIHPVVHTYVLAAIGYAIEQLAVVLPVLGLGCAYGAIREMRGKPGHAGAVLAAGISVIMIVVMFCFLCLLNTSLRWPCRG